MLRRCHSSLLALHACDVLRLPVSMLCAAKLIICITPSLIYAYAYGKRHTSSGVWPAARGPVQKTFVSFCLQRPELCGAYTGSCSVFVVRHFRPSQKARVQKLTPSNSVEV